jgi:peptidoglycan/LPS O-acetylase OafA/YrhL
MRRLLLVVVVAAMMLVGSALPALATHETGDPKGEPRSPQCSWYENWDQHEEWWEYWCYWPHWGWEYVFWSY